MTQSSHSPNGPHQVAPPLANDDLSRLRKSIAETGIARLRWRGSWWNPSTAKRVRIFARPADAQRAADRLTENGYTVELSFAERTPWRVVRPAPWTAPTSEVVR